MNINKFLVGSLIVGIIITLFFVVMSTHAEERIELIPFGDFETWTEQQIKESNIIGGATKTLYKIGGPWSSSNAHARAMRVDKVSVSVTPEKRGEGYCCRMESRLETVKAIGINFKALATGSIYTGKMIEIVGLAQSSDPNSAIDMGVPFTERPTALIIDYKAIIKNEHAIYAPARTRIKDVATQDKGHITLLLQHRWEEDGHIYAYRVGTAKHIIDQTTDWQTDFRLPVIYGKDGERLHHLYNNRHKTHNSQGKMVCIEELDFRDDVAPTHIIIQVSAGSLQPFTGCPGNTVWCDNIRLSYAE